MKKSLMSFLSVAGLILTFSSLVPSARAQGDLVYAVEFNQSNNRFGTIDLWNGNFTQIATIGGTLINDLAYCPTNGMLYGILNSATLVMFNTTNGAITSIAPFSVSGIQSLAFRPSDGVLFGATQSGLYTINPTNGNATPVGSFGSPANLDGAGQNIRFAQDDNLYISNTSMNTDLYRISTTNGSATRIGQAVGIPYLMLMNGNNYMYGVYINLGSASGPQPKLVYFDLASFVEGGTNADGSTHQITVSMVGAGTNFPANFIFSGGVSQPVTNLTVPVSATGPSNQTTVAGSNVEFSTTASGTGPYSYAWSKNGEAISGQTNSNLMLNNVTTADTATYSVIVGGAMGTATNSATLTVTKASGSINLGDLSQTYDGTAKAATAMTTPSGLAVTYTYNDSATVPTGAGSYTVVVTINDANYQGSATSTLVIEKAVLTITADNKSKFCGQGNPTLTASYSGFVNGENAGVLTSAVILDTTATTNSAVGTYPITVGGAAAANYTINYVSGMLSVKAVPQLWGESAKVNGNNQFVVSWGTISGHTYQLEYTDDLASDNWKALGDPVDGTDAMVYVTNNISGTVQRYFRVGVQ